MGDVADDAYNSAMRNEEAAWDLDQQINQQCPHRRQGCRIYKVEAAEFDCLRCQRCELEVVLEP